MEAATKAAAVPAAPPAPGEKASNAERVRWAIAVINTRDVTPAMDFWDGAVEYFPGVTANGAHEIKAYFDETFAAMPDFEMEILGLAEDGENVLMHWRLTGTFNGEPFQGITPTGDRLELHGHDHFVIRDGRVVTNHVSYDRLDFAQQLGMMPPDDSVADKAMKSAFNLKTKALQKLRRS